MTGISYDTTYFPESIVRDGVNGCCHQVAYALHARTGWPIGVLWRDPVDDGHMIFREPEPIHVFCLAPDGRAVDIEGARLQADLIARWRLSARRHKALRIEGYVDIAQYEHAMNESWPMLIPSAFAVRCADAELTKSETFLKLVAELRGADAQANGSLSSNC